MLTYQFLYFEFHLFFFGLLRCVAIDSSIAFVVYVYVLGNDIYNFLLVVLNL